MTRPEPVNRPAAKPGELNIAFIETLGAPAFVLDRQARIVGCNKSWEVASGYARHEIYHRQLTDLLDTHSLKRFSNVFQQLSSGQPGRLEYTWKTKAGHTRMMATSFSPLAGNDGKMEYVIGVGADLSELRGITDELERQLSQEQSRRAEVEASMRRLTMLNELHQRLSASLDYATTLSTLARALVPVLADWCAVDILDREGKPQRLAIAHRHSREERRLWQMEHRYPLTPDASYGTSGVVRSGEPSLLPVVSETTLVALARSSDHLHVLREVGMESVMCVPIRRQDHLLGTLLLVATEPGRRYSTDDLALAGDVAHCAANAIENAWQHREALRAVELREAHLIAVSHELKNPLHTILFLTAYQPRDGAPDEARYLKQPPTVIIQRAAHQMRRLVADLLDLDAIDTGQLPLDIEPADINAVVTGILEVLEALTLEKGIQLKQELDPGVGVVPCDRQRLHQVLANLVSNAVQFTPRGGSIRVRTTRKEGEITLSVSDTGTGLTDAQLPHVFDRYWQAQPKERHGQGLGLAISKAIVEAHGGRIWVESKVGRGAAFHLALPVVRPEEE